MLTAGNSHYFCLSDDEIADLTRVAVDQTAGRTMVVAADRHHATARSVEFAIFAAELGVDVLMCLPPDWSASCTPQTLADHYATVAEHIPVMIVTNIFVPRGPQFGLETIDIALDRSEKIVALKDDMCGDFARRLGLLAHERIGMFAGGMKANHLNMVPYGCEGYLSNFINFKPEFAWSYWNAVQSDDLPECRRIMRELEMPLIDFLGTMQGGSNAAIHAIYEIFGLCKRWRRPPYYSLNDEEVETVRGFLQQIGVM